MQYATKNDVVATLLATLSSTSSAQPNFRASGSSRSFLHWFIAPFVNGDRTPLSCDQGYRKCDSSASFFKIFTPYLYEIHIFIYKYFQTKIINKSTLAARVGMRFLKEKVPLQSSPGSFSVSLRSLDMTDATRSNHALIGLEFLPVG